MSCFVSQNDASTSIWPVWSMNFNNSTLRGALLSRVQAELIMTCYVIFVKLLALIMLYAQS